MSEQRPPASAQTAQWRELAQRIEKHPCQCCADGGYRSNCSCDQVALLETMRAAADACDQLKWERDTLFKSEQTQREDFNKVQADNAKLRELLATAREYVVGRRRWRRDYLCTQYNRNHQGEVMNSPLARTVIEHHRPTPPPSRALWFGLGFLTAIVTWLSLHVLNQVF